MSYKMKAKAYHTAVSNWDQSTVESMVDENYIQHNLKVPTGRAAFVALLPKLKEFGSKIENIRMLEDGDHIIMHHKWVNAIPFGFDEMAAFHIIRFNDDGLIGEHWNVMTELTSVNESARSLLDGETGIEDLNKTESNKSKIKELYSIFIGKDSDDIISSLPCFFHVDFHQHNRYLADGIQSLAQSIQDQSHFPNYKIQHAIFGEGNFVLSISEGDLAGTNSALYDLFRLEEGKIVSHWNIYQEIPTEGLANNNTMFNFQNGL